MKRRCPSPLAAGLVAMGLMLGSSGCARPQYEGIDIIALGGDYIGPVGASTLSVAQGRVLVFEALPRASGATEYDGMEHLVLRSTQPAVANVRRTILADTWTLSGETPGQTTIRVEIDHHTEELLVVTVVEPSP